MAGVPASDTNPIEFPECKIDRRCVSFCFSLNLCKLMSGFLMDRWESNFSVMRVSSAAI